MTVSKLVHMQRGWVVMLLMMVGHAEAANIQLAWDPPPVQAAGYKLYYGQNSRDYNLVVDVGSQTSYTLSGLEGNQGYYFTVTAYDDMGIESPFGDEVSAFLATTNSGLEDLIAPDAILPDAEVARSNGYEGAAQPASTLHHLDSQSLVSSGLPHLTAEQIESGEIPIDHQWRRVEFRKTFVDPIVVARTTGNQQAHSAVTWIRGVDAEGFEVRLGSWSNGAALRPAETVSYLVIERGEYVLPNGILLEAGKVEIERVESANTVVFGQQFATIPVVISSIANVSEVEMTANRLVMPDKYGFQLLIDTTSQDQHMAIPLRVDYIAWEPSWGAIDGLSFEIDRFDHLTEDASQTILFQQLFEEAPVFLADLQDLDTGHALRVCWDYKSAERVELSLLPNSAVDIEMVGRDPQVGYIAVRETLPH
jgi:fibronectin type III domain protein